MRQHAAREFAKQCYEILCNVCTLLPLVCLLSLLDFANFLMKFAQSRHIFVSDYVAIVKICQGELYRLYDNLDTTFQRLNFQMFLDILDNKSYIIC